MQGQQLLETWWLPNIVVAMVIGVADSVFAIGRVRVDEIEKEKPRGGKRIACNDIKWYRGWEG
jgi:hypothetical protein